MSLKDDLKKTRGFDSPEEEAFVSVLRVADILVAGLARLLKARGFSPALYNVLRILRGAGAGGLPCGEIAARMIARDPDVTRLVDRLERRRLVSRLRGKEDRRVVHVVITGEGLRALEDLDRPVAELHREQLTHLGKERLSRLLELLELLRKRR